jgi:RsiW-degrading membrane proteinase PrsW (M82 family)
MSSLLIAAVLPVAVLCYYIYKKDVNKEPTELLTKIFIFGFFSAIPVIIVELFLDLFFSTTQGDFLITFINTFISVALVEEGFKWLITKYIGYDNKAFDEVYDIIVYAVFASLGFACVENILYVFMNGYDNAFMRAIISIPGHTCFAVLMGYFFAQAKIASLNRKNDVCFRNMVLSIIVPAIFHTLFDTFIFCAVAQNSLFYIWLFFIFDIIMVVNCFKTVNRVSTIQQNLCNHIKEGIIKNDEEGKMVYDQPISSDIHYCPICGRAAKDYRYCPSCGFSFSQYKSS